MRRMTRVGTYIERIAQKNGLLNAVVAQPDPGTIDLSSTGLTFLIKDNMCTKTMPTTCCSNILKDFTSPYDATVVQSIRAANGVILGKTNMDEFAMGVDTIYTIFGPVQNPLFIGQNRSAGGSSGGSAAAVAAKFCDVALGTDTGGSVRLPAAFCSVFGFKPSYGRISRFGVISYAQSLDTVGLFARSLEDMREAFKILDHFDPEDPTSVTNEMRSQFSTSMPTKRPLKFGIVREGIVDIDNDIREAWIKCLESLIVQGHEVVEVGVPSLKHALPAYFALSPAEASSNLARYDGIRYGNRASKDTDGINKLLYGSTRSHGFGKEVQRRLLLGTFNLTSEAYDEHFLKAQKVRRLVIEELNDVFLRKNPLFPNKNSTSDPETRVDVLLNPTSPHKANSLAAHSGTNNVANIVGDFLTIPANLAGLPAISIPVGESIGMEVWAQYGDDATVLDVSEAINDIFMYKSGVNI